MLLMKGSLISLIRDIELSRKSGWVLSNRDIVTLWAQDTDWASEVKTQWESEPDLREYAEPEWNKVGPT